MILRVVDNSTVKSANTTQYIKANYDPKCQATTVYFDADVVTLGIVTTFLTTEYKKKRSMLPTDMLEQLDKAINKTLSDLDIERRQ